MIQRFEYSWELFWKVGKDFLAEEHSIIEEIKSPKMVIRTLREVDFINDEEYRALEQCAVDRNETSHLYGGTMTDDVANRIEAHYSILVKLADRFAEQADNQ